VYASAQSAALDVTLAFVDQGSAEVWASEDVGGFESYLAQDEEEETAEAQELYRGTSPDEGPLVNLPASSNTLCLVMRDAQTLRFVKFLSRDAPSSRADVAACFRVDAPENESSAEDKGDAP